MKWLLFLLKKRNRYSARKSPKALNLSSIEVLLYSIIGSLLLSGDVPQWQPKSSASLTSRSAARVNQIAANITVKVYGEEFLGSGTILDRQDRKYLVVTNQHVLRAGRSPFTIQTPDGKIYQSRVITEQSPSQEDLALLSFKSDRFEYQIATTGDLLQLEEGELLFAAGFPANLETSSNSLSASPVFSFTTGEVVVILEKPLQEGYQIVYTNPVKKGMSGGPVLNQQGEVVGVNGRHAYPLWDAPDFYEDNSQPSKSLQDLIIRSSLAIPVEKALVLANPEEPIVDPLQLETSTSIKPVIQTAKISSPDCN